MSFYPTGTNTPFRSRVNKLYEQIDHDENETENHARKSFFVRLIRE